MSSVLRWSLIALVSVVAFVLLLLARIRSAEAGPKITFDDGVSEDTRQSITGLVLGLPAGARRVMNRYGVAVFVVHHLSSNLGIGPDPDTRKWDEVGGVYYNKKVFVATHTRVNGEMVEKTPDANHRTVAHETGHVIDFMGGYVKSLTGRAAYKVDMDKIKKDGRDKLPDLLWYTDGSVLAPHETFAQIFANMQGKFWPEIRAHFPTVTKFVQAKTT